MTPSDWNRPLSVLAIEKDLADFLRMERHLRSAGQVSRSRRVDNAEDLEEALEIGGWTIVISDLDIPGLEFEDSMRKIRDRYPELPIIVLSETIDIAKAVDLLKGGVTDFILKDNLQGLPAAIDRAFVEANQRHERDVADEALRSSEAKLRQVLETAQDGIWAIDLDQRTTLVNPRMTAILGYTADEMLGRPFTDFVEDAGLALAVTLGQLRPESPSAIEGALRSKRGDTVWIRAIAHALVDGKGERIGALGVVTDITTRHLAEREMRLQSAALNASADAVVISDVSGAIQWVNGAFEALTGFSSAEAVGRNPRDLVRSGVHHDAFYQRMWETLMAGQVWRGEIVNQRKDGSRYHEDMTIAPVFGIDGRVDSYIAIKRDLTAKKLLEAQLLQAQKMESVGRLAGGIAHDFNNLLTIINGVSELGLEGLSETDARRKDLQDIHQAGLRAATLTRQLLTFSRKQIVNPELIDVNTLAATAHSLLRRMLSEDVRLIVKACEDSLTVNADLGQLEQVLMNLVVNARDAMPGGGTLTIETRYAMVTEEFVAGCGTIDPGEYAVLTVTDTGVGMDDQTQARIFDPFFTTKEQGKGTGLGLSTVYGIVHQWHGCICVQSTVGQGSTFCVYLPLLDDAQAAYAPMEPAIGRGSETVLIVEDDAAVREMVHHMIRSAGYNVLEAANGDDALLMLGQHERHVDLLLTDAVMPGMSGPELVARAQHSLPGLSVLYMSGHTDNPALPESARTAQYQLIQKPFSKGDLTRMMRATLDATAAAAGASA